MKATIKTPESHNGINYADSKELIGAKSAVGLTTNGNPIELVTIRWYMGRSSTASIVYCTVWVRGGGVYVSGSGKAGGGGYCKRSASFYYALRNAGVSCDEEIAGVGNSQIESACKAIARLIGFSPNNLLFVDH